MISLSRLADYLRLKMSGGCVFCRIVAGETPAHKVYEDEKVLAFLDIHPSAPGHTLIIPKAHVARVEALTEEDAGALFSALHRLTGVIQDAVGSSATTIGINNGRESGQEVPHVHIHVIPRSRGDRGGIIQGIARPRGHLSREDFPAIAEKIKGLISG
ncbi:MAG: HIT family protein [Candidatus Bathyarchaeota archaeon]|jgi:histidine triad (HIT) family protein